MIKIFKITDLNYTVFTKENSVHYLFRRDIVFTKDVNDAHILLIHKMTPKLFRQAKALAKANASKPILIWTHEPRYSKTDQSRLDDAFGCPLYNMNLYTNDVYFSNYTMYGHLIDKLLTPLVDVQFSKRPIVGLTTYVTPEAKQFILNGIDIDLSVRRQNLLIEGHRAGLVDIYGKNWPGHMSIDNSRGPGWRTVKEEILKGYQFNICLENTAFPFYCTEKIWDSIRWGCLPIYSSFNNKIYDTFPKQSFVDHCEYSSDQELFDHIKRMSTYEYLDRMNNCIKVFNNLYTTLEQKFERRRALEAIVRTIREIYRRHCS